MKSWLAILSFGTSLLLGTAWLVLFFKAVQDAETFWRLFFALLPEISFFLLLAAFAQQKAFEIDWSEVFSESYIPKENISLGRDSSSKDQPKNQPEDQPKRPLSASRLVMFLTSLAATALCLALGSLFIYANFPPPQPSATDIHWKDFAGALVALGFGVLPYAVNRLVGPPAPPR